MTSPLDPGIYLWMTIRSINHLQYVDNTMWMLLDKISYPVLIAIAVFMLMAPFKPMPHVAEKLIMLKNHTLTRPIDIFDLFYHLIPTIILLLKVFRSLSK